MDTSIFSAENYQWQLSLITLVTVLLVPFLAQFIIKLVPTFKRTAKINHEAYEQRQTLSYWKPIVNRSKIWGIAAQLSIFAFILPFCMTAEAQPWWKYPLDIFIILMFYDFFYYLVHRFLFHDGGFGPGPLMWVHAVHHQRRNPCREDSAYLHPIETCAGLYLYGASIGVLAMIMGDFNVITIIITWIAFSEINLHNHDLMEEKEQKFPFKYLKYMSFMHHVHHARFTAGNFATISLFYDWLFGTYDVGEGWKRPNDKKAVEPKAS
ncbi:sterol desaturase family protein [Halioxenophilus sp. WMMB6]|uniref:sterol desaturase family protein n=1 Tax=Halioxenophilus sp. WMMB6 TaxID=3073815 RepID=UPI00295F48A2|nr:sterol desaturase family protein [Halioxenophilus sp. WMMB6]